MKECSKCHKIKSYREFIFRKGSKDSYCGRCKLCLNKHRREYMANNQQIIERMAARIGKWKINNREKILVTYAKYCAKNKEKLIAYRVNNAVKIEANRAKYRANNKEKIAKNLVQWRENNSGKKAALNSKRRAFKRNATVPWANQQYIEDLYANCREVERLFAQIGLKVKFNVDHIVPLQHDLVSGLHVEHNLQILTAGENGSKGNKFSINEED